MAVAYVLDADNAMDGTTNVTNTTGFAVGATSNPVIVVGIALNSATVTVSEPVASAGLTATFASVASVRNDTTFIQFFAAPAPSGTGTITVTASANVVARVNFLLFSGADQTTPCPTGAENVESAQGSSPNPLTVTLNNVTANDATVLMGSNTVTGDGPRVDVPPATAQTYNDNSGSCNAAAGYRIGAGAVDVTWVGEAVATDTLLAIRVAAPSGGETITMDKWFRQQADVMRRRKGMVPSGTTGIKAAA